MADRAKVAESAVYPILACEAIAHRHAVAARGLRLHAVGPRTGGDGDAAPRPLRQLRRLLLASPRSISLLSAAAAWSTVARFAFRSSTYPVLFREPSVVPFQLDRNLTGLELWMGKEKTGKER